MTTEEYAKYMESPEMEIRSVKGSEVKQRISFVARKPVIDLATIGCNPFTENLKHTITTIVYVIKAGKYYKIGITSDINKRLLSIQTGNPIKLDVVHTEIGNWHTERALHKTFKEYRREGEWFKLPKKIVDNIIIKGFSQYVPLIIIPYSVEEDICCLYTHHSYRKHIAKMSPNAKSLFLWLMYDITTGDEVIWINSIRYMKESSVAINTFKKSITELCKAAVIYPIENLQNMYWLNPRLFFKGSRVKKYPDNLVDYSNVSR